MKAREAQQRLVDYTDSSTLEEALGKIIVSDECHNPAICPVCEEIYEVEPDAQPFLCHAGCINPSGQPAKVYPLTFLAGF